MAVNAPGTRIVTTPLTGITRAVIALQRSERRLKERTMTDKDTKHPYAKAEEALEIKKLRDEFRDWVAAYQKAVVDNCLAETPDESADWLMRVLADHNCGVMQAFDDPLAVLVGGAVDVETSVKLYKKLRDDGWHKVIPITSADRLTPVKNDTKKVFGSFNNVLLRHSEYTKLQDRFGSRADDMIEELSLGKESKGYKYKSDYAAILKWDAKNHKTVSPLVGGHKAPDLGRKYAHMVNTSTEDLAQLNAERKRRRIQ